MTPDRSLPRTEPLPTNVKLLSWASFLNDVASEIIYPLLPQFLIGVLGGNRFYLGLIEGIAESTASLLKLLSGSWSDRIGRRRAFVLWGYGLATIARPMIGIVIAPWQLFLARTTDRIGKGLRTAPRDALIADSTAPDMRGRAFGFHRAMDHLGAAIGPVVATAFLWFWPGQLRPLFLLTLIPGILVLALLLLGLREVSPEKRRESHGPKPFTFGVATMDRRFRRFLIALVLFTLGNSSDAFLLVRASEVGVSLTFLPLLWLVFHLAKSTGNFLAGRFVDRVGPRSPLLIGWILYAVIYVAFGLADSAWQIWALFLVYAAFYALTEPAEKAYVASLAGPDRRGEAFGWFNSAVGISALPASLIFGLLYETLGPLAAFGWGAILALLASALLIGEDLSPTISSERK